MKQIHLIVPFMRRHLKEKLIEAYKPMNIRFYPIMFVDEETEWNEPWIYPIIVPMRSSDCKVKMPNCFKRNWFIENYPIKDDDYYVTVDDDDMYEDGVFDTVKGFDDDIVVISMRRGYRIPDNVEEIRRYPTYTLWAQEDYMQTGMVSAQQSFVKGKIFKEHLFNENAHTWDAETIIHHKDSGEQIRYERNLFALFNYFEPQRWDKYKFAFGIMVDSIVRLDMVFRQSQIDPAIKCHTIKSPDTAAKGLNKLLDIIEAEGNDIAILSHQDMYYRQGWLDVVERRLAELPEHWTVAGIIGKDMEGRVCGKFRDMRVPQHFDTSEIHEFPHRASCFDECCLIINLKKKFRFDERLTGFDLYGTLCVLQAWESGGSAWVIDAPAEHYCLRPFTWVPDRSFRKNFMWLYRKYENLKVDSTALGVPQDSTFQTSAA